MNAATANLQTRKKPITPQISVLGPPHSNLLQRKCACGGTPGPTGECEECRKNRLNVQRRAAHETESAIVDRALYAMPDSTSRPAYNFATVPVHARSPLSIQTKLAISQPGDQDEQEADRAAEQLMRAETRAASDRNEPPRLSAAEPRVQRQAVDEAPASPAETVEPPAPATPEITPEPATPSETPTAGLLVDDEATELSPGQMKKSEFLDALRTSVCAAADAELAAVGRSTEGCPYIEYWIGYYGTRSSDYIERAIRKYAPETAGVTTAGDYIPLITERMRQGVATWAMTGQITGVPEELAGQLPETGGAPAGAASAASGVVSGMGGVLFKARDGGAREADPRAIQAQLHSGSPLGTGVRARMESAFGHDFSRVRVHADGQAANLSSSLNARAFTIGSDIAFGSSEYQPGTLIGDALLAHELAHVVQQAGAVSAAAPLQKGENAYNSLEEDADNSAVGAVISLWSGAKGAVSNIATNVPPRLKSGLRLQSCRRRSAGPTPTGPIPTDFLIRGKHNDPSDTNNLYFDRGVASLDSVELAKIPSIISSAGVTSSLTLNGYRSEDEASSLANDRVNTVDTELGAARTTPPTHPAHTGTRAKVPLPSDSIGNPDYRPVRKVEALTTPTGIAAAPSTMPPNCTVSAPPCPPAPNAFTLAQTEAIRILTSATAALAPAALAAATASATNTHSLLRDLFGGTNPSPAARQATGDAHAPTILTHLTDLKTHVTAMTTHHVCHHLCIDPGCGSRPGFNTGVGAASVMILCPIFFDPSQPLAENADTLIHEGAHGTTGLATEDLAYRTERRIPFLTDADAMRNTDSYVLLAFLIDAPGSLSIGPVPAIRDITPGGMSGPEEFVTREAAAHLDKWLLLADFDTQILYDTVHQSVSSTPPAWVTGNGHEFNRETMHLIAPLFGLTDPGTAAPFTPPTTIDREKIAAIHDRFLRMRKAVYSKQLTFTKAASGTDSWASGPGSAITLTAAFFTFPNTLARVRRLLELIATVTPDVSAGIVPAYVDAGDRIHTHRHVGP